MPLTTFSANTTAQASQVNANFALCVLTDTARTITVTHTWSASQTFSGGLTGTTAAFTASSVPVTATINTNNQAALLANVDLTASNYRYVLQAQRSGAAKYFLGLDSSDQFVLLNAAANAANLTVTDAGAGTFRGALSSNSATGGVGYATGAGGAVTQATSKSTAVTLNTVSGRITMNNANLNAGAIAGFTFNNSALGAADSLILGLGTGGSAQSYNVWHDTQQAGSTVIYVKNINSIALAEAVTINFAIIKGVTS